MMQPTQFFRLCIVGSIVLEVCGGVVDLVFPTLVPEPLRHAQDAIAGDDLRLQDYVLLGIGVPIAITFIASAIGMYIFRPWAPRVALYVTLGSLMLYLFLDADVSSPASALLSYTSAVLWGIVLAMAFLPPVNARFQQLPANSSMQPTGRERPAAD